MLCRWCEEATAADLAALAGDRGAYTRLVRAGHRALEPVQRANTTPSGRTARTSRPPLDIGTASLVASGGVSTELERWLLGWYSDLGLELPDLHGPAVTEVEHRPDGSKRVRAGRFDQLVARLGHHLSWACANRSDAGEFARRVRRLLVECQRALGTDSGHAGGRVIGRCPTELEEGGRCGVEIRVAPDDAVATCSGCRTRWTRAEWPALAARMRAPHD